MPSNLNDQRQSDRSLLLGSTRNYLEGIAQNGKAASVSMLVSESRLKISPSRVHFKNLRTARSSRCVLRPTHSWPKGTFEMHNTRN